MKDTPGREDMPIAPVRERSLLPAGMELSLFLGAVSLVGIVGGGALSGLLAGHGLPAPGWRGVGATIRALIAEPGDPAAAWPSEPRPGPAWLTWTCMLAVAIGFVAAIAMARAEFDMRRRHRRTRTGMATRADLRRAGLDHHSAIDKAANEFPTLAKTSHLPLTGRMRGRWKR
ncbi:hypothetical protein [Nocardia asiatica]|uniref:hypothetical protein n=1 Tax=Nocardia asiatica TaxID=209252 RepID=UPI0024563863|nr:hypothetical protein [Nocardia asiatica]